MFTRISGWLLGVVVSGGVAFAVSVCWGDQPVSEGGCNDCAADPVFMQRDERQPDAIAMEKARRAFLKALDAYLAGRHERVMPKS